MTVKYIFDNGDGSFVWYEHLEKGGMQAHVIWGEDNIPPGFIIIRHRDDNH